MHTQPVCNTSQASQLSRSATARQRERFATTHRIAPTPARTDYAGCSGPWLRVVGEFGGLAVGSCVPRSGGLPVPHDNKSRRSMNKQHRNERPPRSLSFVISSSATGVQPYCSCGDLAKFPVGEPGRKSTIATNPLQDDIFLGA
jgi:hypothetical protein